MRSLHDAHILVPLVPGGMGKLIICAAKTKAPMTPMSGVLAGSKVRSVRHAAYTSIAATGTMKPIATGNRSTSFPMCMASIGRSPADNRIAHSGITILTRLILADQPVDAGAGYGRRPSSLPVAAQIETAGYHQLGYIRVFADRPVRS